MKNELKPDSCKQCGLYEMPFVPWQEPLKLQYPVLMVGQAPGTTEAITGVPMTGGAGKMQWRLMIQANLNKRNVYVCNVCQCTPPKDPLTNNDRKPTEQEVECCTPFLKAYIQKSSPGLIIACGDVAIKALTGVHGKVTNLRGQYFALLDEWEHECKVLATLHPSFVMRQRQWMDTATKDLGLVHEFFSSGPKIEAKDEQTEFIYPTNESQLAEELGAMSKGMTSFDIETPGELNPRKAEVIGIAFCNSFNKVVAVDTVNGKFMQVVKRFLEDKQAKKITQNGQYDIACLETSGINVKLDFDTLLAEHIIASDMPKELDFLRGKYTNIPPYKPPKREMKHINSWPVGKRLEYNALDALVTWRVARQQMKKMNKNNWHVLQEIDLPLVPVVNKMERKGVLVDVNTLALMYKDIFPQLERMEQEVFGPLGLNPKSPTQLVRYFNIESSGEDQLLEYIKRGHEHAELMQQVLEYRDLYKTSAVYLEGVYNRLEEGRIHANFNISGTGTSRLSSSDPNLQNVPKHLRVIYISDPGKVFIERDYSQLELRVLAVISNEHKMLKELSEGKNPHHILGEAIFNKKWDKLTEQQKLREKAVLFGTAGGRGARSIAMEFNVPTLLAEQWQAMCINQYPAFINYRTKQTKLFNDVGKYTNLFGRERVLQRMTQAFNTPFQSNAGDVTKTTLVECDKAGLDLRLTVHDSITIEVPKRQVKEVDATFKRIVERPIKELDDYSFPSKRGVGVNWYELEE